MFRSSHFGKHFATLTVERKAASWARIWTAFAILFLASSAIAQKPVAAPPPTNKLLYMFRLYYLPFSLYFREGNDVNEILPFVDKDEKGISKRLVEAQEIETINQEWDQIRETWKRRSLFLTSGAPLNETKVISASLISHKIPISRRAFDGISLTDRIKINEILKLKSTEIQENFKQLRFVKSFIPKDNKRTFHFFIISASWCESCLEYRALLETYVKQYPDNNFTLHSIMIDDPKQQLFDGEILKELFPHPKNYSHESIPRFLALENPEGQPTLWEEGEALRIVFERYFEKHRGFLDSKSSIFKKLQIQRKVSSQR